MTINTAIPKTLLIVDDDRVICEQLGKELKRNFFNVLMASSASSGLDILAKENVDILILDVKLPDMDGLEVLGRAKDLKPGCEVIVITGYGTQEIAIESLRRGAIDYVEKPFNLEELSAALGRAQERLSKRDELDYRYKILVIDDEKSIVERLKQCITKEGYEAFGAFCGEEGLDIIENNKIDIIITDIQMDDINGIELFEKAKRMFPDIEGIMVTGFRDRELAIRALRSGAFDYIPKPVDLEELFISLNRAVEKIKLHRTSIYRNRELKLTAEITNKLNQELEKKIEERTKEITKIQAQLFQTSKLATLGEMSAGLAHEINQPLGGIALIAKSFRKLMERNRLTEEEIASGLYDIETQVKRMTKIIQHIRTFARQETLKFIQVDVKETFESALSLLQEQLRIHQIELEFKIDSEVPRISGEPYQLEQVWINLISNARDAMDEKEKQIANGILQVPDYRKMLSISSRNDPHARIVEVTIIDNGIGMSDTIRDKIFQPFFTTKEIGQATGLGLSISYGIIENHKGRIEVETAEGDGTTIKVILPHWGIN